MSHPRQSSNPGEPELGEPEHIIVPISVLQYGSLARKSEVPEKWTSRVALVEMLSFEVGVVFAGWASADGIAAYWDAALDVGICLDLEGLASRY
jgi:hypothetical protein